MAKNKTKKNHDLIFAHEADESTGEPVNTEEVPDHLRRVPKERRLPGGRVLKANGRSYLPGSGNPSHANLPPEAFCTARKTNGQPCRNPKITGAEVCGTHGGRAPQVMRKAMARLQNNADRLVQAELAIALDEQQPAPVRLAALRDALDRAGLKSSEKVELQHSMKPWESILTEITRVPSERADEEYAQMADEHDDDRYRCGATGAGS